MTKLCSRPPLVLKTSFNHIRGYLLKVVYSSDWQDYLIQLVSEMDILNHMWKSIVENICFQMVFYLSFVKAVVFRKDPISHRSVVKSKASATKHHVLWWTSTPEKYFFWENLLKYSLIIFLNLIGLKHVSLLVIKLKHPIFGTDPSLIVISNKLKQHFFNIERTQTPEFWIQMNGHRTSNLKSFN